MLGDEEELGVNDLVKIHTKYFRKRKSKFELQLLKKKKRKKYRLKQKEKQLAMKRCYIPGNIEEERGLGLER
jgi:hypothetical protein